MSNHRARLSQARSRQRRDDLLDAAITLFVEGGTRAVTHRAVAKVAGLPPATPTYYFDTIEDLLREAAERYATDLIESVEGLSAFDVPLSTFSDIEAVKSTVDYVHKVRGRDIVTRDVAVYLQCQSDPMLKDYARQAIRLMESKMAEQFTAFELKNPEVAAKVTISMLLGSALRRIGETHDDDEESDWLSHGLVWLVAGSQLDDPSVGEALSS